MESNSSLPGSPATALQEATPDRMNLQRESSALFSSMRSDFRDSPVQDKISQFNNISQQSSKLDRKTADAALKRAMLGREEAESEMRRYRDDVRSLKKLAEEGRERERRVGERLETVMENYGRAKETFAHTQALWEKEIRRARKENFKSQSTIVKLQEELKAARSSLKITEEGVEREKERSRIREQEAFAARYEIVGVQEKLEQALERIKLVEQARDAFKTLAKEEEVARIAAEGRLPLPIEDDPEDEFASPKKKASSRPSLSTANILSSAASEEEIEELSREVAWERQRADRALEQVEFLQTECQLRCCVGARSSAVLREIAAAIEKKKPVPLHLTDAANSPIVLKEARKESRRSTIFIPEEGIFRTVSQEEVDAIEAAAATNEQDSAVETAPASASLAEPPTPVDATAEHPAFARTPSVEPPTFAMLRQQRTSLLSLLEAPHQDAPILSLAIPTFPRSEAIAVPDTVTSLPEEAHIAEPTLIVLLDDRTVTESDLETTHSTTVAVVEDSATARTTIIAVPDESAELAAALVSSASILTALTEPSQDYDRPQFPEAGETESEPEPEEIPPMSIARPHTSAAMYKMMTTTTTVPLRGAKDETTRHSGSSARALPPRPASAASRSGASTPSPASSKAGSQASLALVTPTVTREQALAQIRERRGRARSAAQAAAAATGTGAITPGPKRTGAPTATPRRPAAGHHGGTDGRREVSAPATVGKNTRVASGGSARR